MPGILAFSEAPENILELVSLGVKLGGEISVVIAGKSDLSDASRIVSVVGVSRVYQASNNSLSELIAEPFVDVLASVFHEAKPELILIASTKVGKVIAARLAARLGLGCISEGTNIRRIGEDVSADRVVWGGNAIATIVSNGPAIVTVSPKSNEPAKETASPDLIKLELQIREPRTTVLERQTKVKGQTSIKDANIVLSAGRGFKKKEDLAILEPLAIVLNAAIGASRPLTSDLGWLPEDRQVGLSGTTVKPKLYIAVGISGQIQHLTGMRDSKIVASINQDKSAPIFQESDYGIVGDLYAIVPMLTNSLNKKLGR